jgi:hypothetical protein
MTACDSGSITKLEFPLVSAGLFFLFVFALLSFAHGLQLADNLFNVVDAAQTNAKAPPNCWESSPQR